MEGGGGGIVCPVKYVCILGEIQTRGVEGVSGEILLGLMQSLQCEVILGFKCWSIHII